MSWDVTPPVNLTFLGVSSYSGARTHILLDRLGKTQSHAFVELSSETAASSILRGENRATPILGVGHRARTITLTRSCQPAFMAVLFPSWDTGGQVPSLPGDVPSLPSELEVMGESEPRRPPVAHTHAERPLRQDAQPPLLCPREHTCQRPGRPPYPLQHHVCRNPGPEDRDPVLIQDAASGKDRTA
ncbi:hypothetical protein B0H13DRAFT_2300858 [Mycena leptocephala]|nr:hypothetical protein B0H13DRAFT_2300858 [Mycena leptocephala]